MALSIYIKSLVQLAGLAQVALALGSLAIPRILNWRGALNSTSLLIRQMFWVYAGYIFVINICFGLVSLFYANALTHSSALAMLLCGFIAVYWISRILLQFLYFERTGFPRGGWYLAGETALIIVFIFLSIVYSIAFCHHYQIT